MFQVFARLKKYTRDPNFKPDKVAQFSVACQSFCRWVLAIEHYGKVFKVVEPKRRLHAEITLKLKAVKTRLEGKKSQLQEVVDSYSYM